IAAAQKLFSQNGYEQTSTASIAKEAGTSESQLVRYFGTKAGLLEALFDVAWAGLQQQVLSATAAAPTARVALLEILGIMIDNFTRDEDLAYLMLFEGRRIRRRAPRLQSVHEVRSPFCRIREQRLHVFRFHLLPLLESRNCVHEWSNMRRERGVRIMTQSSNRLPRRFP
ncbi:MAG: TetR/AcrR family transcriptional regulator; helix-turn-helix transcriptional regulator, partial [Proteobacteria bacterium]|nr:TetR/AcrR family transcriptional regulator; helix-turn-helix transcriptional regulator [Pseudomonadota bacterium]